MNLASSHDIGRHILPCRVSGCRDPVGGLRLQTMYRCFSHTLLSLPRIGTMGCNSPSRKGSTIQTQDSDSTVDTGVKQSFLQCPCQWDMENNTIGRERYSTGYEQSTGLNSEGRKRGMEAWRAVCARCEILSGTQLVAWGTVFVAACAVLRPQRLICLLANGWPAHRYLYEARERRTRRRQHGR